MNTQNGTPSDQGRKEIIPQSMIWYSVDFIRTSTLLLIDDVKNLALQLLSDQGNNKK